MISPDTIAQVRDRSDIIAVILESVPSLKRRGRSFVGLCPFHAEKTPSFHVNPDRGFFHCFGCKESGSVIDFVMKQEGATFPEAVRSLAERAGIAIEEEHVERPDLERVDRQKKQKEELYAASQLAATFFESQLHEHPERQYALDELARRGLVPGANAMADDALQAFRIGYAPAGWDGLATFFRAQGISPMAGEAVGLLVPRSSGTGHYDRFRHRLMFAVTDPQGRVVAFSGRALKDLPDDGDKKADPPPKYVNSPESPIYSKGHLLFGLYQARHEIRRHESAVLVEGNFDVVSLHARGLTHVVAPLGTAFTIDQAKLLKRFATNVVFLFDADGAGKKAVFASRDPARKAGLTTKVASLPDGSDPDDYCRARGVDAIKDVIGRSRGMLEFLLDTALDETFASADAYERAARVAEVAKLLTDEDDPLVRSMAKTYADQLAGRLDLVRSPEAFRALERSVRSSLADAKAKGVAPYSERDARVSAKPPGSYERREMVGALIDCPALLDDPDAQQQLTYLEGPGVQVIAALGRARIGTEKRLDTTAFLAQIPVQFHAFAAERLADPHHTGLEEAKVTLLDNANKLKRLLLSQEASDLARENYRAGRVGGDWETETGLAREAAERVKAKHGLKS